MRSILLALVLVCSAAAQTAPAPTIAVTDENGVAVPAARVFVQSASQSAVRCQTDFNGRCRFPSLPAGTYELQVEKQGFYALVQPDVQGLQVQDWLDQSLLDQLQQEGFFARLGQQ